MVVGMRRSPIPMSTISLAKPRIPANGQHPLYLRYNVGQLPDHILNLFCKQTLSQWVHYFFLVFINLINKVIKNFCHIDIFLAYSFLYCFKKKFKNIKKHENIHSFLPLHVCVDNVTSTLL